MQLLQQELLGAAIAGNGLNLKLLRSVYGALHALVERISEERDRKARNVLEMQIRLIDS